MAEPDPIAYWLNRYATAMDKAASAPGEPSRTAYIDLARHYWSMHEMVHRRAGCAPFGSPEDRFGCPEQPVLRWAA